MAVTPHDAEEALKPYLGALWEADEAMLVPVHDEATGHYIRMQREALTKALDLLGVRT